MTMKMTRTRSDSDPESLTLLLVMFTIPSIRTIWMMQQFPNRSNSQSKLICAASVLADVPKISYRTASASLRSNPCRQVSREPSSRTQLIIQC